MTLTEHACKIYGEKVQEAGESWKVPIGVMELAYNELRDTLDAERAKPKADPDLDRIRRERRAEDRAVIDRIHAALGDGTCRLTPDAVFELALKILKEHREKANLPKCSIKSCPCQNQPEQPQPEPSAPPVYEWVEANNPPEWKAKWTTLALFRNSCAAGRVMATDGSILYFVYPNFIERRNERDTQPYLASSIESAQAAVEAVVRAHYGDEA